MQNLVSNPLSKFQQNLIRGIIQGESCLIGVKSRLLYSCKALKIKFGIYTDRDYKERQGVLKSARSVAANCDEFWITKCNKKNYKVRQG